METSGRRARVRWMAERLGAGATWARPRFSGDVARRVARCAGRLSVMRTCSSPPGGGLEGVQGRLVGREETDLDQVERADERVAEAGATRACDGIAEADRPVVLDEDQRGGRVRRDVLQDVPVLPREDI